ncbi:hypothetical protein WH47_04470 [Habropoda laboriosa]|uniref:Uncharacterized protein n=1 Tax=Habropoda laboriosa TaxID=597456 RepID=A0A0L7R1Z0_9HYME|nr:hypothetical protein WH47_04470 [Habropoda laboriosa]
MLAVSSYGNDAVTTVSGPWQFLAIKSPMGPTRIKLAQGNNSIVLIQSMNCSLSACFLTTLRRLYTSFSEIFPPSSSLHRAHFGIMKSLAVGLTWPRIKFTSFQGCQSSVEFLPLIFPPPRPRAGKERSVGIS